MKKLFLIAGTCITTFVNAQSVQEGKNAMENDKLFQATTIFQNVIKKEPKNAEAYYNLGKAYRQRDMNDSAQICFRTAMKASPGSVFGHLAIAREVLNSSTADAAKKGLLAGAKTNTDLAISIGKGKDITVLNEAANVFYTCATSDYPTALEIANKALVLDKKNARTFITLGDVYTEMNDGGNAAKNYDYALTYEPNNPIPYQRLGVLYTQARNFSVSLENFNLAISKGENYAPTYRDLGSLYYKAKKYDKSKDAYKKYLALSEPNTYTLTRYAYVLFLKKDYDEALQAVNEVQKIDSSNIILKRMLGYAYHEMGKPIEGLVKMEEFFSKAEPKRIIPDDYEYLGKLLAKNGKDSLGIENIKKAISLDTTKANLYYDVADIYYKNKKYPQAAESYQLKINKSKSITAADYFGLGRSLYFNKQYDLADSAFKKLLVIKDNYALGYLYRGKCNNLLNDKNPELAKPFYEKYLELASTDPKANKRDITEAYSFMGYYQIQKNDNVKAKEFYNKVLTVDPENKQAKDILSKIK